MFAIVDCNNFYASCERVFKPSLEGKPIAILSNNDGCIISRSNEAKALGLKMGEPAFLIKDFIKLHHVEVFSSNYALYGDLSERVMKTLASIIPDIEIYSIDEAFLNLSKYNIVGVEKLAVELKDAVKQNVGIPVSVGIAPTKTLAKVANHIAKKNKTLKNICILKTATEIETALEDYPVEEVWGIGRRYIKFLKKYNINTAYQLTLADDNWIKKNLTIMGLRMVDELRGIACHTLQLAAPPKKTICTARSFGKMTTDFDVIAQAVANYASSCAKKLRQQKSVANLLYVFVETNRFKLNDPQYNNFKIIKLPDSTNYTPELIHYAIIGLKMIFKEKYRYKKAGVIVSGIIPDEPYQKNLFEEIDRGKNNKLMKTIDRLNESMGKDMVRSASQGFDRKWKLRQEKLSPCYTSRWTDIPVINLENKI